MGCDGPTVASGSSTAGSAHASAGVTITLSGVARRSRRRLPARIDAVVIAGSSVLVGFGQAKRIGVLAMTDEMTNLREMIGFAAERLMELEAGGLTGAA